MVWKMYLLSNMAILGIYVRFQGGVRIAKVASCAIVFWGVNGLSSSCIAKGLVSLPRPSQQHEHPKSPSIEVQHVYHCLQRRITWRIIPVTLPETNITPENGWLEY